MHNPGVANKQEQQIRLSLDGSKARMLALTMQDGMIVTVICGSETYVADLGRLAF
jgi:hypothetical protein